MAAAYDAFAVARGCDMATHVVLLRGVNVGGHNKLPMADLRTALAAAGYDDVQTYVQSGNVVLRSGQSPKAVAKGVEDQIASTFGLDIVAMARSSKQLADVMAHNPFLRPDAEPGRQLHVAFLAEPPSAAAAKELDPKRSPPDELHLRGTEIYLWCPNGMGKSKVMTGVERILGTPATVRNWRTITELLRMSQP
jgi:uncharacterized protein (DUF1697 family)